MDLYRAIRFLFVKLKITDVLSVMYIICLFCKISFFAKATNGEHVVFVADPVTEALDYVEAIEQERHNCSFGPTLNLQYSKDRWKKEALKAVFTANLLTLLSRTGSHMLGSHTDDVDLLYGIVRANVDDDNQIFGSAIAFDINLYKDYTMFCPYAFSKNNIVMAKDLSIGYDYHNDSTDWFWVPYKHFYDYSYRIPHLSSSDSMLAYADGYWTKPYFDCGGGDVWMVTFSMPFFTTLNSSNNGYSQDLIFAGVTTIDIVLDDIDINQCPRDQATPNDDSIFDSFVNTHKCPNTTQCVHVPHQGFRRGAYTCQCRAGFYYPRSEDVEFSGFNGSVIEAEYSKRIRGISNVYLSFRCLPCSDGCTECMDNSPCVITPSAVLRFVLSTVQCVFIGCLLALAIYTFITRENKVFKAASPGLLYVFLFGAAISYCQIIVDAALPLFISCILQPWFNYIGFSLAYGALLFKTWRITVVFKVRSAKPIRITDNNLFLRIIVLLAIVFVFLGAWMLLDTPSTTTYYTESGLKYDYCKITFWTYIGKSGEIILLAWGVYLCYKVRKAPTAFNEAKFISISIYNETIMALFSFAFVFILPWLDGGSDAFLISEFVEVHISVTVVVALIFISKLYHVYHNTEGFGNRENVPGSIEKKKEIMEDGVVYTMDNISPVDDPTIVRADDVQTEVKRMTEVLRNISEAMRLAGVTFTPKTPKKTLKQPEVNKGYDNNNDEDVTLPSASGSSGKNESSSSGSHKYETRVVRAQKLNRNKISSSDSYDSSSVDSQNVEHTQTDQKQKLEEVKSSINEENGEQDFAVPQSVKPESKSLDCTHV